MNNSPDQLDGSDYEIFSDVQGALDAIETSRAEAGPATSDPGGFLDAVSGPEWIADLEAREREIDAGPKGPPVTYATPGWDDGVPTWQEIDVAISSINTKPPAGGSEFGEPGAMPGSAQPSPTVIPPREPSIPGAAAGNVPAGSAAAAGAVLAGIAAGAALIKSALPASQAETPPPVRWHYLLGGKTMGPVAEPELRQILSSMPPDTMVWNSSLPGWEKAFTLGLSRPPIPPQPACPRCKQPVQAAAKFCPSCGNKLA